MVSENTAMGPLYPFNYHIPWQSYAIEPDVNLEEDVWSSYISTIKSDLYLIPRNEIKIEIFENADNPDWVNPYVRLVGQTGNFSDTERIFQLFENTIHLHDITISVYPVDENGAADITQEPIGLRIDRHALDGMVFHVVKEGTTEAGDPQRFDSMDQITFNTENTDQDDNEETPDESVA